MAQLLSISYNDVNGEFAATKFWCNDVPTAIGAVQDCANLSNAQIVAAWMSKPIDLSQVAGLKSAPVAANNETVKSNVTILLSGPDVGSVSAPRGTAEINIPAPKGDLVNGLLGDVNDARAQAFLGKILTRHDVTTDRVDKIHYTKVR